jgi:predicted branched-subunit amino acid permease
MLGATAPAYPAWVGGTVLGVFAGDWIGDPAALGLDAIFPAFFLALLIEGELRPGRPAIAAALGALIAVVLTPFTPAGVPIIAASAAALIGLGAPESAEEEVRPDVQHAYKEASP